MGTRTPTLITGTINGTVGSLVTMFDTNLPALGWSIQASSGNERIYAPGAGGTGTCLYVLDDGSVTGGAREAVVRLVEPSSTIGSLVNPSPTVAQQANNSCVLRKSNTLDATSRPYLIVGDSRFFAIRILSNTSVPDIHYFGDMENGFPSDSYNAIITQRGTANSGSAGLAWAGSISGSGYTAAPLNGRCNTMRSIDGLTLSDIAVIVASGSTWGGAMGTYPHPATTKIHYSPAGVASTGSQTLGATTGGGPRGLLPFVFEPHISATPSGLATDDVWTDTAYDASSQFLATTGATGLTFSSAAAIILQTAGTWDPDAMLQL